MNLNPKHKSWCLDCEGNFVEDSRERSQGSRPPSYVVFVKVVWARGCQGQLEVQRGRAEDLSSSKDHDNTTSDPCIPLFIYGTLEPECRILVDLGSFFAVS